MITTTLSDLRQKGACLVGYNRLVRYLQGRPYTLDEDRYIHCHHKDPIPLSVIFQSNGVDDALWALRACEQTPELVHAERMFAVTIAQEVKPQMTHPASLRALETAERMIHEEIDAKELAPILEAAQEASKALYSDYFSVMKSSKLGWDRKKDYMTYDASRAASACILPNPAIAAYATYSSYRDYLMYDGYNSNESDLEQVRLFVDLFLS